MLEVKDISLSFGGVTALKNVEFTVSSGELFSIIGPNGAGKTSLLNCISGRYKPAKGDITFSGQSILSRSINDRASLGIGRTFQNVALFGHMSVLDNILVGRHHLMERNLFSGMFYWFTKAQHEEIQHRCRAEEIIDFLEIQHVRNEPAGTLSYGLRKRVELARGMAIDPMLMLLDEPMAGMNLEEKEDMARYITDLVAEFNMTVIMIEHDMGVVTDLSDRILVLDFGRKIAMGKPGEVLQDQRVRAAYLGEDIDEREPTKGSRVS
jgi:branched-chain amino acid transport system ATP-binding protein